MEVHEADLQGHLSNNRDNTAAGNKPKADDKTGKTDKEAAEPTEKRGIISNKDLQFRQALTLLKSLHLLKR